MNHINRQTCFELIRKRYIYSQQNGNFSKFFHFILPVFLLFCFFHQAQAQAPSNCTVMIGQYNVAPFTRPLGLAEAARYFGLSKPLGEPAFKVEKTGNTFWHIGLVSGVKYEIALEPKNTRKNSFLPSEIIQCSYNIKDDIQVIQADLSKLPAQELEMLADYIPRGWGSTIVDFGSEEEFENPKVSPKKLQFTANALRNIRYFLVSHVSMVGGVSYYQVIPLQKYSVTKKSK